MLSSKSICHLTSGVYFLNAGVLASEAGMPASYASRIVAATLIVVRPSSEIAPPRVTALPGHRRHADNLLTANRQPQFTWIEGGNRPIRQFGRVVPFSLLERFES